MIGRRVADERGMAFPSPVVMVSIVAVAMAALALVLTGHHAPTEREITTAANPAVTSASPSPAPSAAEPKPPLVRRNRVYVEVYNNSGITGLAGKVASRASRIGWQVVGSDNWYGTIPGSTVYYPRRLKDEAKQLGLDLGIRRVQPAVAPMRMDRLTVILTDDAR